MNKSVKIVFIVLTSIIFVFMLFGDAICTKILGISYESEKANIAVPNIYKLVPAAEIKSLTVAPKGWRNAITINGEVLIPEEIKGETEVLIVLNSEQGSIAFTTKCEDKRNFLACIPTTDVSANSYTLSVIVRNKLDEYMIKLPYGFELNSRKTEVIPSYNRISKIVVPKDPTPEVSTFIDYTEYKDKFSKTVLTIGGWAFRNGYDSANQKIFVSLRSTTKVYTFEAKLYDRYGFSSYFVDSGSNLDISTGFFCDIDYEQLIEGTYSIDIIVDNNNQLVLAHTGNEVIVE